MDGEAGSDQPASGVASALPATVVFARASKNDSSPITLPAPTEASRR